MVKKIWLIDDDEGILEVTKIVLEDAGYIVNTYRNYQELIKGLEKGVPDIFLLDIMLAGVSGAEISKNLKSSDVTSHIPLLLMSADSQIEEIYVSAGANGYIKKPYDISELVETIKKHIRD